MPPKPLVDVSQLDREDVEFTLEEIRKLNPQRFEFEQLTAILSYRPDEKLIIGLREVREDEFWVRGHMPERPLMPGVLMIEAAAQLCSFYCGKALSLEEEEGFYAFGGIEKARFRGTVSPNEDLILLARPEVLTRRRSLFVTQGVVDGQVVVEASILGVRLG